MLHHANLPEGILVDCSHANSGKRFERQEVVWQSILDQRQTTHGQHCPIIGAMLESNLVEGNQPLTDDPSRLRYGVSITDSCIGWEKTEALLRQAAEKLS